MSLNILGNSAAAPSTLLRFAAHFFDKLSQCMPKYIRLTFVDTLMPSNCSVAKPLCETPSSRIVSMIRCCTSIGMNPARCTKPFCNTTTSRSALSRSRSTTSSTSEGRSVGHKSKDCGAGGLGAVLSWATSAAAAREGGGAFAGGLTPPADDEGAARDSAAILLASASGMVGELIMASPSFGAGHRTGCKPLCAAERDIFGSRQILWSPPIFNGTANLRGLKHQKMYSDPFSSCGNAGFVRKSSMYSSFDQQASTSTQPSNTEVG
mmetsp:Transcript_97599/g.281656  ORF Transcript_97599/g.281656 Transcript_97599/m.281656 type:complete len:265 (+) Transcript_97599:469-1263(+)